MDSELGSQSLQASGLTFSFTGDDDSDENTACLTSLLGGLDELLLRNFHACFKILPKGFDLLR